MLVPSEHHRAEQDTTILLETRVCVTLMSTRMVVKRHSPVSYWCWSLFYAKRVGGFPMQHHGGFTIVAETEPSYVRYCTSNKICLVTVRYVLGATVRTYYIYVKLLLHIYVLLDCKERAQTWTTSTPDQSKLTVAASWCSNSIYLTVKQYTYPPSKKQRGSNGAPSIETSLELLDESQSNKQ